MPAAEAPAVAASPVPVGGPPPRSRARLWLAVVGLALCLTVILMATLSPTPLDRGYESAIDRFLNVLHRQGVPEWFGYRKLEFSANIAMFVPLGFLIALALPFRRVWAFLIVVPAVSALLELAQLVFLTERFATLLDVLANTLGGYLGAAAAILVRIVIARRDKTVVARALWWARQQP